MRYLVALAMVSLMVSQSSGAAEDCGQTEALDKLTRMGTFKQQYMRDHSGKPDMIEKVKELAVRTSHGGTLIGQQKYGEACKHYDQLAADFGFDLSQSKAMSVAQINEFNQNAEEGCDIRSIMQRNNASHLTLARLPRQVDNATYAALKTRSDDIGMLMRTDLARACEESRKLEADLQQYAD